MTFPPKHNINLDEIENNLEKLFVDLSTTNLDDDNAHFVRRMLIRHNREIINLIKYTRNDK